MMFSDSTMPSSTSPRLKTRRANQSARVRASGCACPAHPAAASQAHFHCTYPSLCITASPYLCYPHRDLLVPLSAPSNPNSTPPVLLPSRNTLCSTGASGESRCSHWRRCTFVSSPATYMGLLHKTGLKTLSHQHTTSTHKSIDP